MLGFGSGGFCCHLEKCFCHFACLNNLQTGNTMGFSINAKNTSEKPVFVSFFSPMFSKYVICPSKGLLA